MPVETIEYNTYSSDKTIMDQISSAATYEPKRSMTNSRLVMSGFSLFLGIFTIYVSLFYAPAFFDFRKTMGLTTERVKLPSIDKNSEDRSILSNYSDLFKLRRGYFSAGQYIYIDYALSPETQMYVKVQDCAAPVIIEVFICQKRGVLSEFTVETANGARAIFTPKAGFYYFDEVVTDLDGNPTKSPHAVVYRRGLPN